MIIAKFIQGLRDNTVITQENILSKIVIEEDLDASGTCEFTMPIVEGIEEDTVVELYEIGNSDTLLFRGYIHQIKPIRKQFNLMEVTVIEEKTVMSRRHALSTRSFSGSSFSSVITTLLGDYTTYGESRSLSTDIGSNVSLDVAKQDVYSDIFDELAEQFEAKRWVKNGTVYFMQSYGVDKSTGDDYQEVVFDKNNPSGGNISNVDLVGIAKRATVIIGKDKSGSFVTNTDNYSTTLYGTHAENFRDGNLADKTAKKAEQLSKKQRIYNVFVDQNAIVANIGDKVRLTVANTNSFFDIDATVTVSKKTTTIDNAHKAVQYELQEFIVEPVTEKSFLRNLSKKINLLQS